MSREFSFKQFTIIQNVAGMKVGTDGVLLGSWTITENVKTALDVGTGTGLLALMIAQRNQQVIITAIEPDILSFADAETNIGESKWQNRITLLNTALNLQDSPGDFDLMICNPPYFKYQPTSTTNSRQRARSSNNLTLYQLFEYAHRHLTDEGRLSFIYPAEEERQIINALNHFHLKIHRIAIVLPLENRPVKRLMIECGKKPTERVHSEKIIIEESRQKYHTSYYQVTKDFYLYM
jgi:tRNA1Val (adenine37-N6)-methyltransferase